MHRRTFSSPTRSPTTMSARFTTPGDKVVDFQQPVEMVNVAHTWIDKWVMLFSTDGRAKLIFDGEQS